MPELPEVETVRMGLLPVMEGKRIEQAAVNRPESFETIRWAAEALRGQGVTSLNLDLMYGLPGQTPDNVADSLRTALTLAPDRVALFGYAHVPWMKKHQAMIRQEDLADVAGRWRQAEAAETVLLDHGYVRIGMDHFAHPGDRMAVQLANGGLRRNFQGYTDDTAPVLVGLGASSISRFPQGFAQNASGTADYTRAIRDGGFATHRGHVFTGEDVMRARIIEALMCDFRVDRAEILAGFDVSPERLEAMRAIERSLTTRPPAAPNGSRTAPP